MTEALLTIQELAAFLSVPVGTIYKWRWKRIGPPAFRVGGKQIRFRRSDVEQWLASQRDTQAGTGAREQGGTR